MAKFHVEVQLTLTRSILVEADDLEEANNIVDDYTKVDRRFHLTPDVELGDDRMKYNGDRWELDEYQINYDETALMDH